MTTEKVNLETYQHYCTCGGYAAGGYPSERDADNPHLSWCAQYDEYWERRRAIEKVPKNS